MKVNIYSAGLALTLCLAMLSSSCSDRIAEDVASAKEDARLEIIVDGINMTRSLITGTTLPDNSRFAVFYNSPYSVGVSYANGICTPDTPISIKQEDVDRPVYAVYPYGEYYLTEIPISLEDQTDYLRGISVDDNGMPSNINVDTPKARIRFDHILARITLNIHKDASIDNYYKIPGIYLGGYSENSWRTGIYSAEKGEFYNNPSNAKFDIKGELKDGKYVLETADDVVTVDFLVLPTETSWSLQIKDISSTWWSLPKTNYESGKQYIYDCKIGEGGVLEISECDIKPWENTDMPEIETY